MNRNGTYWLSVLLTVFFLSATPSLRSANTKAASSQQKEKVNQFIKKSDALKDKYNYIQADLYLDSALIYGVIINNEENLAAIYLKKGIIKTNLNDFGAALDFYIKAMNGYQKLEDWAQLISTYVNIAEFYRKTGNYKDAKEYIERALHFYETKKIEDLKLLNKIYNRSAAINNEYNPDPNYSLNDSRKALELAKKLSKADLMAVSFNEMGFTYKNLGEVDSAEFYYKEAERLWMNQEKYQEAFHAMANRAQLYQHNNYPEEQVINLYNRIAFLSDSVGVKYPLMNISWALYNIYLNKGDTSNAFRNFLIHHDESMEVYNSKTRSELHNVKARFKNEEIQNKYQEVTQELSLSSKNLEEKKKQQLYLIISIAIMGLLLVLIVYLFFRLRTSNKVLSQKNNEKDTLIQEIHHRVKNNLQFISSLINMQVKNSNDIKESQSLNEASRRINAMALVHEMLYNTADQKGISVKYYLEELIDSLFTLINSKNQNIDIQMDITDAELNVSDTISIGIITSELISNSMKHAFKNTIQPRIDIKLSSTHDNSFTYTVKDNGKGTQTDINFERTLGLRLIDIFSRQLKGSYKVDGSDGFNYSINFSIK